MEMPGRGGGGSGGGGRRPPDLEVIIKNSQNFIKGLKNKASSLGIIIAVVVIIVVAMGSFYTVGPEELGVVRRFGKVVRTANPGPHFKIPFIENVLKPQVTKVHRIEVGFKTIDPGPPARYTSIEKESLMLTGDENIVAVEFIVQFKIRDPIEFLFNVRGQLKTIKDAAEASMREVVGKTTISEVLTGGRFQVQQEMKILLQAVLDKYDTGIAIVAVQLQDVLPPKQVFDAFKDVASAREDRERAVEQAEGYRNDLIPKAKGEAAKILNEAMGYREASINKAKGDTSRFLQVLKEYRKARNVTQKRIYIETMAEVLGRVDKFIIEGAVQKNMLPYLPLVREPKPKGRQNK
jgi:membrane protease subunit HflK